MEDSAIITKQALDAITDHAKKEFPLECCGLLGGADGVISQVHPLRNESRNPTTRYFAAPEDLFAAMRRIRQSSTEMMGVYHSHPKSAAYPSQSDVQMAFYPEALYFIISIEPQIEIRAFRIENGAVREVLVRVVDSESPGTD